MGSQPGFVFVTCQVGAEPALKSELARRWPQWRFAYSRPGFLTFKLPADAALTDDFALDSVFARAYGLTLGKVAGDNPDDLAQAAWRVVGGHTFDRLHVWQRDTETPGRRDFEPSITAVARTASMALHSHLPLGSLTASGDDRGVVA